MAKSITLAVTPSIRLRKNQATLYEFILQKHKTREIITLNQVVEQYVAHGCRNMLGGKPACYRYDWKEHREYLTPLDGDELRTYALQWFIRNLGVFVIKGLLTAIPTMELSSLQIEE